MGNYRFILSGGGTGGHIHPAIAIANELKRRHPAAEFLFVGAKDRMEMEKVPKAGYRIEGLWISGLQRNLSLKNLLFPIKLICSLLRSKKILKQFMPHAVVGTGGFASGPLLKVASGIGLPCLLQEQNSYAGITNRWLKDKVEKICVAYDGMDRFFPKDKIVLTGNPVRQDLVHIEIKRKEALRYFELDSKKGTLLILGGSLGAGRINELVEQKLPMFANWNLQIIWQCGKNYFETYKKYQNKNVKIFTFLNRMDAAFAASDTVISRAGAGTVSELCLVGKPVLFIPSPHVAEDHQTKNAMALVHKNAAIMLSEDQLALHFDRVIEGLIKSKEERKTLANNISSLAKPHATSDIVDQIEQLLPKLST